MVPSESDSSRYVHDTRILGKYNPEFRELDLEGLQKVFPVPCGRCIGCRLDMSRRWADRMMLELDHAKKGLFVTLTYNEKYVPIRCFKGTDVPSGFSLEKADLQKWLKRLRKRYCDTQIRYYAAGEYGPKTLRPHYHAIVFGIGLDDFSDCIPFRKNELGQMSYISSEFGKTWSKYDPISHEFTESYGFHLLAPVSWETCAYVARYVQKKVYGSFSIYCDEHNLDQEFALMSRDPGLGGYYPADHPGCFELQNFYVKGSPRPVPVPKYLLKKLSLHDIDLYDSIVMTRQDYMSDRELLKLQSTDLGFSEQLELEEDIKLTQASCLRRSSV